MRVHRVEVGASQRVFTLLDTAPAPLRGGRTLSGVKGRLQLTDVTFAYPARPDVPVRPCFRCAGRSEQCKLSPTFENR